MRISDWSSDVCSSDLDYLEEYAARLDLPVHTEVLVDRLGKEGDHFVVTSGDRRWEADNVVVATGGNQAPRIPDFSGDLAQGTVQLSSEESRVGKAGVRTGRARW